SPPLPAVPSPATRLAPPPAGGADATWWNSVSVQYTLFLPSTATAHGCLMLPLLEADCGLRLLFSKVVMVWLVRSTRRIAFDKVSAIYRFPSASTATPLGWLS